MQGNGSAGEVIEQLGRLDRDPAVDVVVIARGGGSVEDLLPFSDEGLLRAVFAARTPVVSAIGHEPDSPLLDLVADVRASTPTDAAKLVVPDVAEEVARVEHLRTRGRQVLAAWLAREQHALDVVRARPSLADPGSGLTERRREVDALTEKVIAAGLATWSGGREQSTLIVRGMSNLIEDVKAAEDLERVKLLFDDLETQTDIIQLLGLAEQGEGVRIFIGSENKLFSMSGSSLVVAPFRDGSDKIVGVLGVIGPTRLNYARIVPAVDYTAQLMRQLLSR